MTRRQRRDYHTASRHRGWSLFMALLTSPLGGYLYLGRPLRLLGFVGIFALAMALVGYGLDTWHGPLVLADLTALGLGVGALADQWWLIGDCRSALHRQGLTVRPAGS